MAKGEFNKNLFKDLIEDKETLIWVILALIAFVAWILFIVFYEKLDYYLIYKIVELVFIAVGVLFFLGIVLIYLLKKIFKGK